MSLKERINHSVDSVISEIEEIQFIVNKLEFKDIKENLDVLDNWVKYDQKPNGTLIKEHVRELIDYIQEISL